ncbi:MAG: response regulator [Alphaproteobacteria bacterium]|nr:response regulator [Alphaproteobacteria bacterium]MCB9792140.1 response regulator [Alphaproteobacteria bacterium]
MQVDFRGIVDGLADPVFVCDEDGLVQFANAAAHALADFDEEFFEENPADSWLYGDDGLLWPPSGEVAERPLTLSVGARERKLNGRVSTVPVNGAMGWMIQLHGSDPGLDKLAGMRAVASVVAQQLSMHLRTIIGNSSQALMEVADEAQAEHLRAIHAAGQAAAGLQRQVHALGGGVNELEPCALGALLLDAQRSLSAILGPDVSLRVIAEEEGGQVLGDPDALTLLLTELAEWVRGNDPHPERVELRVEPVGKERVRLVYCDDGPGLSAQERERLFDPTDGERLGLALVFAVVTRHGGRLLVESTPGEGTALHLEFPSHTHEARKRRQAADGGETVLVVEDDPSVLEWVEATLSSLGYRVLVADNGIAASVVLREQAAEIDLLLTDAVLPGRSGPELIAEARTLEPPPQVLLMSGFSEDFLGEEATEGVQLLSKPFGPTLLVQRIREMLGA